MENVNRLLANICSENLSETRDFYMALFDFEVNYESDWFVHLISKNQQLELGIISASSDILPENIKNKPQGIYITIVVDKVYEVYENANDRGLTIISDPEDTVYGQRRLQLKDPNGVIIDVSSPIQK